MEYVDCNGMQIPLLGIGTYSLHQDVLKEVVALSLKNGYRLFDTAQLYENEQELWNSLTIHGLDKDNLFYQTKIPGKLLQGNRRWLYLNRRSIKQQCVKKYSFMGGRLPDVYLFHSTFQGFEKQYVKLLDFQQKYNIPLVGVCNASLKEIQALHNYTNNYPQIVQVEIHPYHSINELVEFCKEKGIVVEARSPFAHGDAMGEWKKDPTLTAIALNHNKTVPQIILRWIIQQQIIALPRTTNPTHIEENSMVFDFQLSSEEMKAIFNMNKNKSYGVKSQVNK